MTTEPLDVLIVDDEALARLRLRRYLEARHPDWTLREAADGVLAVEACRLKPPDLMFLDVEMPELSGFDVLRHLEVRPRVVIFQTAYGQFAVKAFDENACDYLLKPFTDERLERALSKAIGAAAGGGEAVPGGPDAMIDRLDRSLVTTRRYMDKLLVEAGPRTRIVDVDEVVYFTSEEHMTRIFLADVDYAYGRSLTWLEERLDPEVFIRLHRHNLVRLDAIVTLVQGANAEVTLKNGVRLAVSRERRKRLVDVLARRAEGGR